MDVGAELRLARERRGLSLHELSDRTKIGGSSLRAIETNDIARLPGGIFTRGFLKAYAREVGLDPAGTTDRYVAQFEPPPEQADTPAAVVDTTRNNGQAAAAELSRYTGAISAAAVIVILAACFFVLSRLQTVDQPGDAEVASGAAAEAARGEVGTTGSPAAVSPSASESALRVELQPTAPCWIAATADGTRVAYRLMQPGERQTIEVRDALVLRAGDGAGCRLSINGTPARPLGQVGEPVTITITPKNYLNFI